MRERLLSWADYFGAIALALWVAAGILFLLGNQPNERLIALVVIGALFAALFIYTKFGTLRSAATSRGARYGSNALLVSVAVIGIVAILNFMGVRYHNRFDITANKTFTLSPLTTQALLGLKEPVQAIAFFTTQADPATRQDVADRLREYARVTDKFTYKFVDPQADPQIADQYKVQFDGTVVFERGTRRENALQTDESSFTNAILKVSQDQQPTIYFTTGHGEHSPDDSSANGYDLMKGAMEAENYKVATLDLKTLTDTLPSDITALIIAGPHQPFDPREVQVIQNYLDKNGRVLVMVDPQMNTGLDDLLKSWGITVNNDIVIDPKNGFFGQAQVPVINTYQNHPVTQDLTGQSTFFPGARSLAASAGVTRTVTPLFATSDASWGETDLQSVISKTQTFDPQKDIKGPLNLAIAAEASGTQPARLVVVGSSAFITNGTLTARVNVSGQAQAIQSGNGLLFGNALHWLAGQENLIAIPPKAADTHPMILTNDQSLFILWSSLLLIPIIILIVGALVWWRRR